MPESGAELSAAEKARLEEIARLRLYEDGTDEVLETITRRASEALELPVSLVSIVLDDAQHFLAAHGVEGWMEEAGGTPKEWSFCANAVASGQPFVVEDAQEHPKVRDNPLVKEDSLRCYAGVPLITARGYAVGTLCVLGTEERAFAEGDLAALRDLADQVVERLEARAAS